MKKQIFVCSDIHNGYTYMINALNEAGFDENNDNHLLVVCGDIFDRLDEAVAVYEYLKRLTDNGKAIVLKGNHDSMLIGYLDGTIISPFNYLHNGTNETLADFLHRTAPFESWCTIDKNIKYPTNIDFVDWLREASEEINNEYPELIDWLNERPYYFETKNYIMTHGAIDTLAEDWREPHCTHYHFTNWEALIWNDGSFFGKEINNTDKTVIIGHFGTSHLREMYDIKDNASSEYDILVREDKRVIALDATTALSKKVNVLKIEDELI